MPSSLTRRPCVAAPSSLACCSLAFVLASSAVARRGDESGRRYPGQIRRGERGDREERSDLCGNQIYGAFAGSSTRHLLDGVAMSVPYRSTEHPTHWLISTQAVILEEKDIFIKTLIQTPKGKN